MRIGNKYVQIIQGNKTYTKRNMILNKMKNRIFQNQIEPSIFRRVKITECYIKFDTPLEDLNYDSDLRFSDFDVEFSEPQTYLPIKEKRFKNKSILSDDSISINYKFSNDDLFTYNGEIYQPEDFEMFVGRKITAIGFGENDDCLAVVDVSNMNIIINSGETLEIFRTDTYQSDAKCDGIDFPLHLVNGNAYYEAEEYDGIYKVAKLYSIGLGNRVGAIENEIVINPVEYDYTNEHIKIEFSELIKVGHYPSEDLFPGFYPTNDNSKYLILKYRLCKIDAIDNLTPLDKYYTMSYKYDLSQYEGETKNISFTLSVERM